MSFKVTPKLAVCHSCHDKGKFLLSDATGPWDAALNPTGWAEDQSGDNIEINNVESSALTATSPSGVVYGPYNLMRLTVTTASFTVPAVGSTVTVSLSGTAPNYTAWMSVGMSVLVGNAGIYTVVSFTATSAVLRNAGTTDNYHPANANAGSTINAGASVGVSALPAATGESLLIDISNILSSGDVAAYADGVWSFDWVVKGVYGNDDTPFRERCLRKVFVTCSVACCVDKLNAKMDPTCGCSGKGNKSASVANLTLLGANAAFKCGNEERAKFLLEKLQGICNNNCKGC
jgi:hypothetical protein